jgi:hypothetical protein
MSKKKESGNPSEVPEPDKNPEVKPGARPEQPALPDEEPKTMPEIEPETASPAEIPVPPQKTIPGTFNRLV